ncbi:MAG: helix-turn-helix domain-containing protein [Clostridiales bacterium]|nr:helix-turn-helix domain-containing protein [Clostridiales bacterium]
MITLTIIRERLIEAIKLSGMPYSEIARQVNVKQPTISQYLSGKAMPALDTFAKLCKVLDVDPAYILGLTDN